MHDQGPPVAPTIDRRIRFAPLQILGILGLAAFPALALAGVFGEGTAVAEVETPDLRVQVRYSDRLRYKQMARLVVEVENRGLEAIDTVTVALDPSYVLQFSNPLFIPSATVPFRVPLTALGPGRTERVLVKLQGERYGRHDGELRVTTTGGDSLIVSLSTLVFP